MSSSSRRTVLRAAGTVLLSGTVGCIDRRGGGGGPLQVSVASADTGQHDVSFSVEMLEPTVNDAHPARLAVSVSNEGAARRLSPGDDICGPLNRGDGGSAPGRLWLHLLADARGIDHPDGRWTRDAPASRSRGFGDYGCHGRSYESGEHVTTPYEIWDDYQDDGYYPSGTYRFETDVAVYPADDETATEPVAEFGWGFTLRVGAD
jgi:hypothetical protein